MSQLALTRMMSTLTVATTIASVIYYWLRVRPRETQQSDPVGPHLVLLHDPDRPPAHAVAELRVSSHLTPQGWQVAITNVGSAVARQVSARSLRPVGTGLMPWVVEPIVPLVLPPQGRALLRVLTGRDSAAGVELQVSYRDREGQHHDSHELLIDKIS